MQGEFDIAVIGSGFAGSLMAMIGRRLGRSVVLIERGRHPRFAIGESSTPLASLLLEQLAKRYDLPQLLPFVKWGAWQDRHRGIACGLKRGFTFFHHQLDQPYAVDGDRHRQFLVAASPRDAIADTHWFREEFDQHLVHEARSLGVEFLDQTKTVGVGTGAGGVELKGRRDGNDFNLHARFVVDASGPRGALFQALRLTERPFAGYPATETLFTHFRGVRRFDELYPPTAIPPYPPDAAAVHHVFPGGWIWVLRFNNGVTSAGAVLHPRFAREVGLSEGAPAWERLLRRLPGVREQFADAQPCRPFVYQPAVAFRSAVNHGANWALLPSAAGFIDPLLSTGFSLTLLGIQRLAMILDESRDSPRLTHRLGEYGRQTDDELEITGELIGALHRCLDDPRSFNALTLAYFAAASFSESAMRLGRSELATGFLLCRRPGFADALRELIKYADQLPAGPDRGRLVFEKVVRLIEPVNVAGLGDARCRNWYDCRAEDLLAGAAKLNASEAEIHRMLVACGFDDRQAGDDSSKSLS